MGEVLLQGPQKKAVGVRTLNSRFVNKRGLLLISEVPLQSPSKGQRHASPERHLKVVKVACMSPESHLKVGKVT